MYECVYQPPETINCITFESQRIETLQFGSSFFQKIWLPKYWNRNIYRKFGYRNLEPKYVSRTGGIEKIGSVSIPNRIDRSLAKIAKQYNFRV
jgi:hypothetical protein